MAVTAIWNIKGTLSKVIQYTENPDKTLKEEELQSLCDVMDYAMQDYKTEKRYYVSGINCFAESARNEMMQTKKRFGKIGGNTAYHGYQSFSKGEVTAGIAHQIGCELARRLWGERYEVVVATHLDKECIHNHFVINSVSFVDGKKYNDCKTTYRLLRETSDALCKEYGLSVLENAHGKGKHYSEWLAEAEGRTTWRGLIRSDIDSAVSGAFTFHQMVEHLKIMGYEVKLNRKYIALRPEGKERFVRLRSLGEEYTEDALKEKILYGAKHKQIYSDHTFHPFPKSRLTKLYYRYLYELGMIGKKNKSGSIPFLMKEKELISEDLINEYHFLLVNRIETMEELAIFRQSLEDKKIASADPNEITQLRKDIRLCNKIEKRSREFLAEQEYLQNQREKEDHPEETHERIQRKQ